ncbi:DNA mismatch repair protein MutL [Legionella waltersii]|uniref:DNA mismatch repair protein MutL n=2 Tax=Legionella waltersii TaxID=66969 RepID=A0A0W1AD66_9GAMM|nr:DNA mismatch repair endonuclease MutL [Legionella waltersii]KTD79294.1 DNA mismatch repair protein MutL [Legionella waltersii]SNV12934.1 DNA mismatch repair protein MutL [Legionella waltersii]
MRIRQLSPAIANQIAAGEVIERPSSVVKELLENALDAGASDISIEIGYGGLLQIKVSDNGSGILADDLPLAVSAHATSKITTLNDLYAIESMGFRGEALASIASVSRLIISSKPEEQEHGMMLKVTGSDFTLNPCPRTTGTTVEVLDLFYNAPVRKRFLKSEKIEFQAIEMLIKRFALSAPEVGISLKHNKKSILVLPPALNEKTQNLRRARILGNAFMKESFFIESQRGSMSLRGWISGPNLQRSQSDKQWIYLNQRMVKDKLLQHALKKAYDDLLHPGRFPVCLLYFQLPTEEVDVNVHPTKHEVRFQQPRLVHDFLSMEIRNALQSSLSKIDVSSYNYVITPPAELEILEPGLAKKEEFINSKPFIDANSSWIAINAQFALMRKNQSVKLVDLLTAYQHWLQQRLNSLPLPLKSRPLLVPIRITLDSSINLNEDLLAEVGVRLERVDANQFYIRTIPTDVPYLDLQQFFSELPKCDLNQIESLIHLLSTCQRFDATLLSPQEHYELQQWFAEIEPTKSSRPCLSRELSIEDCKAFMHD